MWRGRSAPEDEFADKTDVELPGFRYMVSIADPKYYILVLTAQVSCKPRFGSMKPLYLGAGEQMVVITNFSVGSMV